MTTTKTETLSLSLAARFAGLGAKTHEGTPIAQSNWETVRLFEPTVRKEWVK